MNTDELIERIHAANVQRRRAEHHRPRRTAWRIAISAAAVAAVLLIVFLPRSNEAQASTPAPGIYCNAQCSAEDVLALIGNNINHIKQIQQS